MYLEGMGNQFSAHSVPDWGIWDMISPYLIQNCKILKVGAMTWSQIGFWNPELATTHREDGTSCSLVPWVALMRSEENLSNSVSRKGKEDKKVINYIQEVLAVGRWCEQEGQNKHDSNE